MQNNRRPPPAPPHNILPPPSLRDPPLQTNPWLRDPSSFRDYPPPPTANPPEPFRNLPPSLARQFSLQVGPRRQPTIPAAPPPTLPPLQPIQPLPPLQPIQQARQTLQPPALATVRSPVGTVNSRNTLGTINTISTLGTASTGSTGPGGPSEYGSTRTSAGRTISIPEIIIPPTRVPEIVVPSPTRVPPTPSRDQKPTSAQSSRTSRTSYEAGTSRQGSGATMYDPGSSRTSRSEDRGVAMQHRQRGSVGSQRSQAPTAMEREFTASHAELQQRARVLLAEMRVVGGLGPVANAEREEEERVEAAMEDLGALLSGRLSSVVCKRPPRPARAVAREVVVAAFEEFDRPKALDVLVRDLGEVAEWATSQVVPREVLPSPSTRQVEDEPPSAQEQPRPPNTANSSHSNASDSQNVVRQALATRQALVSASLPARIAPLSFDALTHFTHENGLAHYTNTHTFRGRVPIEGIPRERFFVTADGWAWDVRELAAELMHRGEGADGVLRNPVTGAAFERDDVRRLVAHPFGRGLNVAGLDEEERRESEREEGVGVGESGGIEVRAARVEEREEAAVVQDLPSVEEEEDAEAGPWVEEMAEEAWPAPEVVPEQVVEGSGNPFTDSAAPLLAAQVAQAVRIPETIHELQAAPTVQAIDPRSMLVNEQENRQPEEFSMLASELESRPTSPGDRDEEYNALFRNSDDDALAPPSASRQVPTPLSWNTSAEQPSSPLRRTFSTTTGDSRASDGEWYLRTRDPP